MESDLRSRKLISGASSARRIGFGLEDDSAARLADESLGERQVGPFILPPFQRKAAWTRAQQVRLVESIWLDLPIAAYVFNESSANDYATDRWLIDGQQRWTAIQAYVADEFEVFGYRHSELSRTDRIEFRSKPFACIQTKIDDPDVLREIYDRLAYGGTPHEPADTEEPSSPRP